MKRVRALLILGIWVAILPYLGFSYFWKNILLSLSGLGLIYFSYILYRESKVVEKTEKVFDNFSENDNFASTGGNTPESGEVAKKDSVAN